MPRGSIPPRPVGYDREAVFMQAVWDRLWSRGAKINSSPTVRVSDTANGLFLSSSAGGGGASKLFLHRVTNLFGEDYFGARKWNPLANDGDGDFMGPEEMVAKSITGRMPDEETIDTVDVTYTYQDGEDNVRSALFDLSGTEWQVVHPRYVAFDIDAEPRDDYGSLILVQRVPNGTGVVDSDTGAQIYLQEVQPCRNWAYQRDQSGFPEGG